MKPEHPVRNTLFAAVCAVLLQGCASGPTVVEEKLDPLTGVTVTRSAAPLVLYRDNSASAAHARDYVYVGPVLVNRMGQHDYYLWLGIWSTMREQDASDLRRGFESIVVYADGEPLELDLRGLTLDSIGVSEPVYVKPVASAADAFYPVTRDQIRLIAEATDVRLRTGSMRSQRYELWENQGAARAALQSFLGHLQ